MIPVSGIVSHCRTRYEAESGGSSTRYTDADIRLFINEGLETLAEATGFYERYVTVPLAEGRTYYDLRGFTPETVVKIKSVWSTSRNDWLKPVAETDLDINWEDEDGAPLVFFTRGIHWLGINPKPSATDTGYLRVYFSGLPGRFTHPQAVLGDLPYDHTPALEDYALYEMAALDRQTKLALLHWKEYSTREKSLTDFTDRRLVGSRAGRMGSMQRRQQP